MASSTLVKSLTTPNKLASALDWKKISGSTILSLDIHKDRIGLAIASHPSFQEAVKVLKPLRLDQHKKKTRDSTEANKNGNKTQVTKFRLGALQEEQRSTLSNIVSAYNVCGVVVSWPLQEDTGKMGAACGHVLNTLEDLVSAQQQQEQQQIRQQEQYHDGDTDTAPALQNRPICLWDSRHTQEKMETENKMDEWGRSVSYSHHEEKSAATTSTDLPPTVREQFPNDENVIAAQIWNDFCRVHWPNLFYQSEEASTKRQDSLSSLVVDEDYDEYFTSSIADNYEASSGSATMRRIESKQW